jgi:hypothetical protein
MSLQIAGLFVGLAIFAAYLALAYHFSKPGSYEKARDFRQMGIGRGSYRSGAPSGPAEAEAEDDSVAAAGEGLYR